MHRGPVRTTDAEAVAESQKLGWDVFLSYSRRDAATVERIATRLKQAGLEPWLDTWCLTAGQVWMDEAGAALARSPACGVFIGPHDLGPWERLEVAAALDRAAADAT